MSTWKPLEQLWSEGDEKAQIARRILDELFDYALTGQVYPNQKGFFHYLTEPQTVIVVTDHGKRECVTTKPKYAELTIGSYNHWFRRLVEEGYIFIDRRNGSRSIGCTQLEIREREEPVKQVIKRPEPEF